MMSCQAGNSWTTPKDFKTFKKGKEMKGVMHTLPATAYMELIIETLKLMHVVQIVKFFN